MAFLFWASNDERVQQIAIDGMMVSTRGCAGGIRCIGVPSIGLVAGSIHRQIVTGLATRDGKKYVGCVTPS